MHFKTSFLTASILLCSAAISNAQTSVDLLILEGDAVGSSTVTALNAPFVNGLGQFGFNATLADGTRSIWFNGGEIFNSDDALPDVLAGGEGTMGIGNAGQFIYSPSFNGDDAVFGEGGLILVENTQAPGFAAGINSTFHSRPQMTNDGTSYWVAGFNDGAGGTATVGRMMYRRNPDGTIDVVLRSGDVLAGGTVDDGSAIQFDYGFSSNNAHSIMEVNFDTGSTANDSNLLVDLSVVATEATATGQGDNWDNFDHSSINNSGNYVFSGDTDGATTTDEFIAYNGVIQLREDDVIGAGQLDGSVDSITINDANQVAFIWDIDEGLGATEALLFAEDGSNLADAIVLARIGDELDIDNDGNADWILADFNAGLGPGIALTESMAYVEVDLESLDGLTNVEAIIGFQTVAIPEPSSVIFVLSVLGSVAMRRRRK